MRTTLTIDSQVLAEFKRRSAETHRTISRPHRGCAARAPEPRARPAATKPARLPHRRWRGCRARRQTCPASSTGVAGVPAHRAARSREATGLIAPVLLPDLNVLIAAHRSDSPLHAALSRLAARRRTRGRSRSASAPRCSSDWCASSRIRGCFAARHARSGLRLRALTARPPERAAAQPRTRPRAASRGAVRRCRRSRGPRDRRLPRGAGDRDRRGARQPPTATSFVSPGCAGGGP